MCVTFFNIARHVGDMGNMTSDANGNVVVDRNAQHILWRLNADNSIIGRALVIHEAPDIGTQVCFYYYYLYVSLLVLLVTELPTALLVFNLLVPITTPTTRQMLTPLPPLMQPVK